MPNSKPPHNKIRWTPWMLSYLKRHFATTLNEEMAGLLGVSLRTVNRKAKELGLEKNSEWLQAIWAERRLMANAVVRLAGGNSGTFKKGEHRNPAGEFKPGHKASEESRRKAAHGASRYWRAHPRESRERGLKGWQTRRERYGMNGLKKYLYGNE